MHYKTRRARQLQSRLNIERYVELDLLTLTTFTPVVSLHLQGIKDCRNVSQILRLSF